MPEPPQRALELITAAAKLASEALAQLSAGPPGPASALLALALMENRNALDRARLTAVAAGTTWEEAYAAGQAAERAAQETARSCLRLVSSG
jgi:hypothetical protein